MGYAVAWLAVRTADHEAFFAKSQVRPTGEPGELLSTAIAGAALEGGWYLLVAQGCGHRLIDPGLLTTLSLHWDCVACSIEEHLMFSSASFWRSGEELWSISHDAQEGMSDLTATGDLPASFEATRERIVQEQESEGGASAEVDLIFEIPLLLAREVTGFKHDEEVNCLAQAVPTAFRDDAVTESKKRPWWKLW